MAQIPRSRLIAYAAGALLVLVVGMWSLRGEGSGAGATAGRAPEAGRSASPPDAVPDPGGVVAVEAPPAVSAVVHVAGAVRRTGVYRLPDGSRVKDAVERAGGATQDANLDGINLAAKVADGQQIVVPEKLAVAGSPGGPGGGADGGAGVAGGEAAATAPAAPVGLNAATPEQLQTLDGVGPATAEKIIAWRTEHGGFRSVDDLGQIPGIGPKRIAALRDHVQP